MTDVAALLTAEQAFEAAYRFVWQYMEREPHPDAASLQEMVVAMEPSADPFRTNDPASWTDWQACVAATLDAQPVPRFPRR